MSFDVKIKVDQVQGLADRLGSISASTLGLGALQAVNEVTARFDEAARAGEIADINLSPAYVKGKTDVVLATPAANPRAEIITRGDLTILSRYEPLRQLRASSTRKADDGPRRGRPRGVAVQIRRSRTEVQPKWFTMRLRRGLQAGPDVGVFVRDAGGRPRHIYGPSPYSLFRHQIAVRRNDLEVDLERTAMERIGGVIEGALT